MEENATLLSCKNDFAKDLRIVQQEEGFIYVMPGKSKKLANMPKTEVYKNTIKLPTVLETITIKGKTYARDGEALTYGKGKYSIGKIYECSGDNELFFNAVFPISNNEGVVAYMDWLGRVVKQKNASSYSYLGYLLNYAVKDGYSLKDIPAKYFKDETFYATIVEEERRRWLRQVKARQKI